MAPCSFKRLADHSTKQSGKRPFAFTSYPVFSYASNKPHSLLRASEAGKPYSGSKRIEDAYCVNSSDTSTFNCSICSTVGGSV